MIRSGCMVKSLKFYMSINDHDKKIKIYFIFDCNLWFKFVYDDCIAVNIYVFMYVRMWECVHACMVGCNIVAYDLFVGSCFVCVIYYDFIVYYCELVVNSF